MPEIVIAIATFRRPRMLERLLVAIAALQTDASVRVVVADNDAEAREGAAVVGLIRPCYRWPLEVIIASERGISHARNALVDHVLTRTQAQYIAMLDDDDWPEPGWLEAFLSVARETKADALRGAVLPEFEHAPGLWARSCRGLAPLRGRTGQVRMIHGTSNVLIRRDVIEKLDRPWFDPDFALSGGEDKDFFTRLRLMGARFAWADDAIVHASVPPSRANPAWALKRAYRVGNSDMRVFMKHEQSLTARLIEAGKIAAALTISPALGLLGLALPRWRMSAPCRFARAAGKLAAVFGSRYDEYLAVHGR